MTILPTYEEYAKARGILLQWTQRIIRARYQQSILGWSWAIMLPAAQVLMFTAIFTYVIPVKTGEIPYVAYVYVAIVPWTFLGTSLTDMTNSLVENMTLVTKIHLPRQMLPLAAMLSRLMDMIIASVLFVPMILYLDLPVYLPAWTYLILILAIQMLLVAGIGLFCAASNVFLRDVRPVVVLGIQLWFYASPILYPVDAVPDRIRTYYALNPMVGIVEAYRDVLLRGRSPGPELLTSALVAILLCLLGHWYFRRVEDRFADLI